MLDKYQTLPEASIQRKTCILDYKRHFAVTRFCELRYTDVHKRVTDIKQNGVVCSPKCMFFAEYSLLAMFDTYPACKCTTQNMYTRICAGLVAIVSLRTALGSLKEERKKEEDEDEQFAWATISVYHFRNVCQPR